MKKKGEERQPEMGNLRSDRSDLSDSFVSFVVPPESEHEHEHRFAEHEHNY